MDCDNFVPTDLYNIEDSEKRFLFCRNFSSRRDHTEICIPLGQIELPQLFFVDRQSVRVIGIGIGQEQIPVVNARQNYIAQIGIAKDFVTDEIDSADIGDITFVDFEDKIDAILIELDDFRLNRG